MWVLASLIKQYLAAVHRSRLAHSDISLRRKTCRLLDQQRTKVGSGADQHSDASVALKEVPGIARLAKNHHFWVYET
jgi:hypothetical protein